MQPDSLLTCERLGHVEDLIGHVFTFACIYIFEGPSALYISLSFWVFKSIKSSRLDTTTLRCILWTYTVTSSPLPLLLINANQTSVGAYVITCDCISIS